MSEGASDPTTEASLEPFWNLKPFQTGRPEPRTALFTLGLQRGQGQIIMMPGVGEKMARVLVVDTAGFIKVRNLVIT